MSALDKALQARPAEYSAILKRSYQLSEQAVRTVTHLFKTTHGLSSTHHLFDKELHARQIKTMHALTNYHTLK